MVGAASNGISRPQAEAWWFEGPRPLQIRTFGPACAPPTLQTCWLVVCTNTKALEAVVEPRMIRSDPASKPNYVVGVDGSAASIAAARWAAARAARDGAELLVVHAYLVEALVSVAGPIRTPDMHRVSRRRAGQVLSSLKDQLGSDSLYKAVAVEGSPDRVLLELSEKADLLVLGARPQHRHPHARFIGATAGRCLRGSTCPVVVVPGPADAVGAANTVAHGSLKVPIPLTRGRPAT